MSKDDILDGVREIEKAVGLDQPLFLRLIDDDDWSFVIKLHALIEAAVTHLLVIASGKNELENVYMFLELSDNRTGKLAFVRELGLLENKYRRFIKTLSELRNKLVHNVSNVGITLDEYLGGLDSQQRRNFVDSISFDSKGEIDLGDQRVPYKTFVADNPKLGIWLATMDLLGDIYVQKQYVELRARYLEFAEGLAKAVRSRELDKLKIDLK